MKLRFLRNALLLCCLLVAGGGGYFFLYPQLRAAWYWRQAREEIAHGDFHGAQQSLHACLTVWPGSAETHFLLARTARRAGDLDDARAHLQEAGRLEWPPDQIHLEELLLQAQVGNLPRAEPELRGLLAHGQVDEPLILEALVRGCLQCNFAQDALRWGCLWTERHPDDWLARFWQGAALEACLQTERAVEQYQLAVKGNANHAETRLRLAGLLLRLRRYPDAREQYHALLLSDPEHAAALLGSAHCQRAAGEIDAARNTLDRLLAQESSPAALSLRGLVALDRNDPRQAVLFLRRADAQDPYDRPTLMNLAAASRMLNEDAEARTYEQRADKIDKDRQRLDQLAKDALDRPAEVELRAEAGSLCLRLGKYPEALRWLAGALVLDPHHVAARKAFEECLDKITDPALHESYRALLSDPPPSETPGTL